MPELTIFSLLFFARFQPARYKQIFSSSLLVVVPGQIYQFLMWLLSTAIFFVAPKLLPNSHVIPKITTIITDQFAEPKKKYNFMKKRTIDILQVE